MAEGRILTGTSGYSYKEWKGSFYPQDLAQTKFLEYYAEHLPTVEINNTFYRFPSQKMLEDWRTRTPDAFRFAIKANQRITHTSRLQDVSEVTRDFLERCGALGDKLGPILFQLPPNLKRDDERLDGFLAGVPRGARCALEFRHATWFDEAVYAKLSGAGVALVISEDDKGSAPRLATADFCYVRLRKDEYDEDAQADWAAWFAAQSQAGRDVYAYLKHDQSGPSPEPILQRLLRP